MFLLKGMFLVLCVVDLHHLHDESRTVRFFYFGLRDVLVDAFLFRRSSSCLAGLTNFRVNNLIQHVVVTMVVPTRFTPQLVGGFPTLFIVVFGKRLAR